MTTVSLSLFPVPNGFAKVTVKSPHPPIGALATYKTLLIELSKRDLLKKAQACRVWLEPGNEAWTYDGTDECAGSSFPAVLQALGAMTVEYRLEIEPSGIGYTSLITSYSITCNEDAHASWAAGIDLPPRFLEHVVQQIIKRRDWIETEMFPLSTSERFKRPRWANDLRILCSPP